VIAAVDVDIAVAVGEAAARRDLRAQIARLEARGARALAPGRGPRLLSLGELEAVRDALSCRRTSVPSRRDGIDGTFADMMVRFEAMVADPGGHRRERITLAELGRPGCGVYAVRPRLGLLGMLAGWWQITLSSGCP
jgi:hypothetical protein